MPEEPQDVLAQSGTAPGVDILHEAGHVAPSEFLQAMPGTMAAPAPARPARPANALDLKPRQKIDPSSPRPRVMELNDQSGKNVGRVEMSITDNGTNVHIGWISGTRTGMSDYGEPQAFGLSIVRDLKNQLKEMFPGVKTISGTRVSGAREKAQPLNPDDTYRGGWTGTDVKIPLSEATDEELHSFMQSLG
jgi:hypothetical protein